MFIYTYACHEDETELCQLELSLLLAQPCAGGIAQSDIEIAANRSPFIRRKIHVQLSAGSMEELVELLPEVGLGEGETFKVVFTQAAGDSSITYEERRQLERLAGASIRGKAEMRKPDRLFGLIRFRISAFPRIEAPASRSSCLRSS
ncbi:hypothetical protein AB4Z21_33640 [Paenibacillus sp. MCAF20]